MKTVGVHEDSVLAIDRLRNRSYASFRIALSSKDEAAKLYRAECWPINTLVRSFKHKKKSPKKETRKKETPRPAYYDSASRANHNRNDYDYYEGYYYDERDNSSYDRYYYDERPSGPRSWSYKGNRDRRYDSY